MRRSTTIVLACLAGAALTLVPATGAVAKSKKKKVVHVPTITKVAPMRIQVGRKITIRGKYFSSSRKRNTVVIRGTKGRSVLAKPSKASTKKLVVAIPRTAERVLTQKKSRGVPTRVHLRVITKRKGKLSAFRQSPVLVTALKASKPGSPGSSGGGSGGIGAPCGTGNDWDGDLLSNQVELQYALNPCKADSDADGMTDGWEYWSAKDLNVRAVPYPGKKPYPNPLDGSDANIDFDGDSLLAREEYRAWVVTGRAYDPGNPYSTLGYSDGTQSSRPTEVPATPAFRGGLYGLTPPPAASFPAVFDTDGDGRYTDDERDADRDGLDNFIETHGPGTAQWWTAVLSKLGVEPWPGADPSMNYSYYGAFSQRPFADTALDDGDVDGDSLLDGEDDQDNDGVSNFDEMYGPLSPWAGNGNRKNAFNPCAPVQNSRTCPRYFPAG